MFGDKKARIKELERKLQQAAKVVGEWGDWGNKINKNHAELFCRLQKVYPVRVQTALCWGRDAQDLQEYVEHLEKFAAEQKKTDEINRLADEKVAEHVAKLHKAKKKK